MTNKIANTFQRNLARGVLLVLALFLSGAAQAQTTAFTYQGKLTDNSNPANGQYDFQFKLFDTSTVGTGTQLGSTATVPTVQVTAGIFAVQLDFGVSVFPGAARYLEIAVKQTSGSTFTTLGPRQPVTSNPYSIRSLAATAADGLSVTCVGCITSSQIQTVQGSQVTGLIPVTSVPPGSDKYVQNSTSQQATTNFNISGTGAADILNATTQFNLDGNRILSSPVSDNFFAGIGAGSSNTTGTQNSFFGINAGQANTAGGGHSFFGAGAGRLNTAFCCNSFFGRDAGKSNTTGTSNSFFGDSAGENNTTGLFNSSFGHRAGRLNTTTNSNSFFGDAAGELTTGGGGGNSFFGAAAGQVNTTGGSNSFYGERAGLGSTTGGSNSFFGESAGLGNTTGNNVTVIGSRANVGVNNLDHATVIGADAIVSTSNTVVVGRNLDTVQIPGALSVSGGFGANILDAATQFNIGGNRILSNAGTNNAFAGIGAGAVNTGSENAFFGRNAGFSNTTGSNNSFFGNTAGGRNTTGGSNSFFGSFAGSFNTGDSNSFFGVSAGNFNSTGSFNAFFGKGAGNSNDTASGNSFFGTSAGFNNTTGQLNAFFGEGTGSENTSGTGNTFIGRDADFDTVGGTGDNNTLLGLNTRVVSGVSNATAIGSQAQVSQSNSLILGGISGINGGTNTNVGIGTTAPRGRLEIVGNWDGSFGAATLTGDRPTIRLSGGPPAANQQWILHLGSGVGLIPAGSLSFFNGGTSGTFSSPAMALTPTGTLAIPNLGAAGATTLCRNASNEISSCSSSLRYKTSVQPFAGGLEIINRLRPISFTWKQGETKDIGLGAEDVERVEPLLTFRNDKGEIEGVKYSQLNVVLINAVKQQQEQIEALKKLVCADHPIADLCK